MRVMVAVKATRSSEAGIMPSEKLLADMGNYAEHSVMRSWAPQRSIPRERSTMTASHNHVPLREGRNEASSLSGARKRPRLSAGGRTLSMASSFAVGSART